MGAEFFSITTGSIAVLAGIYSWLTENRSVPQRALGTWMGVVMRDSVHQKLTIVDGLIFFSDGTSESLRRGNVAAANVTVCGFQSDFITACDELARWHHRISLPDSTWHLVHRVEDISIAKDNGQVGLIMGWQNLRPIEDKVERLAFFHAAGVRIMQLTYNERNLVADGCLEPEQSGLSAFGARAVQEMNRLGIAIDLSHVGERASHDVIDRSDAPVLITHANAKAIIDAPRNKSDELLKRVAAKGGTIGATIHGFMCWNGNPKQRHRLADYVEHITYLRDLVGIDHVAIGTDFPAVGVNGRAAEILELTATRYPSVSQPYAAAFGSSLAARYPEDCNSPSEMSRLTDALLDGGWSEDDLRALYGANLMRVLEGIWKRGYSKQTSPHGATR
jgi:membrane dipeptidase